MKWGTRYIYSQLKLADPGDTLNADGVETSVQGTQQAVGNGSTSSTGEQVGGAGQGQITPHTLNSQQSQALSPTAPTASPTTPATDKTPKDTGGGGGWLHNPLGLLKGVAETAAGAAISFGDVIPGLDLITAPVGVGLTTKGISDTIHAAGVLNPSLLGPCGGKKCETCMHFDETIGELTASSETQKPSKSSLEKAKGLKAMKKIHQKARV